MLECQHNVCSRISHSGSWGSRLRKGDELERRGLGPQLMSTSSPTFLYMRQTLYCFSHCCSMLYVTQSILIFIVMVMRDPTRTYGLYILSLVSWLLIRSTQWEAFLREWRVGWEEIEREGGTEEGKGRERGREREIQIFLPCPPPYFSSLIQQSLLLLALWLLPGDLSLLSPIPTGPWWYYFSSLPFNPGGHNGFPLLLISGKLSEFYG